MLNYLSTRTTLPYFKFFEELNFTYFQLNFSIYILFSL
jgi:hypothetical protein